jgi:hypothetical protein
MAKCYQNFVAKMIQKEELQSANQDTSYPLENVCLCTPASNATGVLKMKNQQKLQKEDNFEEIHTMSLNFNSTFQTQHKKQDFNSDSVNGPNSRPNLKYYS